MFLRTKYALKTQMLGRARYAFHAAKNKLRYGSINKPNPKKALIRDKFFLLREILISVDEQLKAQFFDNGALPLKFRQLCNNILMAFLAELYQCGNCAEYAALIHTDYLENGINQNIEIITVESKNPKVNHSFFVSNRDSKSDLQDPKKWRAVSGSLIINDPWLHPDVNEHTADNMPDKKSIIFDNETATAIRSYAPIDKELHQAEWKLLFDLFKHIPAFITVAEIEKIIKNKKPPFVAKDEHARIIKKIEEKISHLKECAQNQRTKIHGTAALIDENYFAKPPKL